MDGAEDDHSIEDVNWADSCLVKVSDNEWDSLKNSLLEILDSVEPSADNTDNLYAEANLLDEESPLKFDDDDAEGTINYNFSTSSDEEEEDDDENSTHSVKGKKFNKFRSRTNLGNSSVPVIHEFQENTYDFGLDFSFTESILEPSAGEIFKVWDLDIPDEEDELLTNLNKALVDSSLQSIKEDDLDLNGFSNSIDEVIMGMTDLKLDSNPDEAY
ncbi:uncharacterized protein LOC124932451 [Impatiens glandulifera]|uniref:uncharacterized protein LOC124932451 n=1 Tax=Impatiens glandulifera TaxID=253017 RepID=UPI001FB05114|nr:uncharacterized protein LOC124932451 [Impatiens glandulifera]XP_047329037.1 uncharacterized protein LOC124932451 [Impatiens glandulifera]